MNHEIRIIRTDHEDPTVPPAFHATCGCGWALEGHDEDLVRAAAEEHTHGDHAIPAPASPSPLV